MAERLAPVARLQASPPGTGTSAFPHAAEHGECARASERSGSQQGRRAVGGSDSTVLRRRRCWLLPWGPSPPRRIGACRSPVVRRPTLTRKADVSWRGAWMSEWRRVTVACPCSHRNQGQEPETLLQACHRADGGRCRHGKDHITRAPGVRTWNGQGHSTSAHLQVQRPCCSAASLTCSCFFAAASRTCLTTRCYPSRPRRDDLTRTGRVHEHQCAGVVVARPWLQSPWVGRMVRWRTSLPSGCYFRYATCRDDASGVASGCCPRLLHVTHTSSSNTGHKPTHIVLGLELQTRVQHYQVAVPQ
jgi:hypothetical protein